MDLLAIKADTQTVQIRHPGTGALTGLAFELASADSDAVKRVQRRQLDKMLRSGRNKKPSAEEIEAQTIERIGAAVVGWTWADKASWGGTKLEFTKENVATVLGTPWVRSQIQEVIEDEAGFFKD